jgi:hydrogenase expression/formation protein HypE
MQDKILLAHGGGGLLSGELVREMILPRFGNPDLERLEDSAVLPAGAGRMAFTTDSYVVSPLFFPGGCIGDLAVCGTVNDLAMMGARARYLSLALILEEGLAAADLERILDAAAARAEAAGVRVVCGDTKVVPRGLADGLYVNTAGVGLLPEGVEWAASNLRAGDALLVTGPLGMHGLAVMLARGNLNLQSPVRSDVAPLNAAVEALLGAGVRVRAMRDLTRGGLGMAVHDFAAAAGVTLEIEEAALPRDETQLAACELLGLDPLYVACEGCCLIAVEAADEDDAVRILRQDPACGRTARIGTVQEAGPYPVELVTAIGSRRVISPPRGEQMPRIC